MPVGNPGGWHGAFLHVDISSGRGQRIPLETRVLETWVGGVGLGTWLALQLGGADIADAFDPASPLVFASSPLVGTSLSTSAKLAVVARSPLTGLLSDALTSSHFAVALKRARIDALVVTGRCGKLSELIIDEDDLRMEDAAPWRFRSASDCRRNGYHTAAIGPAGEHRVRFANISNNGRHAGRGGLGAVMGSKNLKAISIRGRAATPLALPAKVAALSRELATRSLGPATAKYRELGTLANLETFDRLGVLPKYNFSQTDKGGAYKGQCDIDNAQPQSPDSKKTIEFGKSKERSSCATCQIGCEHRFGRAQGQANIRLEYESAFALGPMIGMDDPSWVLEAAARCDALGLDTISTGGTLATAMELGGLGVRFGDSEGALEALDAIAFRRGAGDMLAEGSMRLAQQKGQPDVAMHVKGMELPGYDPRGLQAMGLGFAVGTRGADHNRSGGYELDFSTSSNRVSLVEADVARLVCVENTSAAFDSMVLCKFLRGVFSSVNEECAELMSAVTGKEIDIALLGERVVDLRKIFNMRAGWRPADDVLPQRLMTGAWSPDTLKKFVGYYNRARGWNEGGYVPPERARALGMEIGPTKVEERPIASRNPVGSQQHGL